MIKVPYSTNSVEVIAQYFLVELGGCKNLADESAVYGVRLEKINGGNLRGMSGYVGHLPEKNISWAIAPGGGGMYIETVPESFETMIALRLS